LDHFPIDFGRVGAVDTNTICKRSDSFLKNPLIN